MFYFNVIPNCAKLIFNFSFCQIGRFFFLVPNSPANVEEMIYKMMVRLI